jgi:hypothetical protein
LFILPLANLPPPNLNLFLSTSSSFVEKAQVPEQGHIFDFDFLNLPFHTSTLDPSSS